MHIPPKKEKLLSFKGVLQIDGNNLPEKFFPVALTVLFPPIAKCAKKSFFFISYLRYVETGSNR